MNRLYVLFLATFLVFTIKVKAGVIIIEGKYQNKNLYVQNGYAGSGVGFCTYEVSINGQVSTDELNSTAFEIDFSQFQIKPGTEVVVEIKHKDDCNPKILNPDALKPRATFEMVSLNISSEGLLKWTTKNEAGSLPFVIEQFRWNKWVYSGEINGNGTSGINEYSFQTTPHSGENKFRIKQVGYETQPKYSETIKYISSNEKMTFASSKTDNTIAFSGETLYEVYDPYGVIVKRGYGKKLDVSNLEKGNYYLCYDNSMTEFRKK